MKVKVSAVRALGKVWERASTREFPILTASSSHTETYLYSGSKYSFVEIRCGWDVRYLREPNQYRDTYIGMDQRLRYCLSVEESAS